MEDLQRLANGCCLDSNCTMLSRSWEMYTSGKIFTLRMAFSSSKWLQVYCTKRDYHSLTFSIIIINYKLFAFLLIYYILYSNKNEIEVQLVFLYPYFAVDHRLAMFFQFCHFACKFTNVDSFNFIDPSPRIDRVHLRGTNAQLVHESKPCTRKSLNSFPPKS